MYRSILISSHNYINVCQCVCVCVQIFLLCSLNGTYMFSHFFLRSFLRLFVVEFCYFYSFYNMCVCLCICICCMWMWILFVFCLLYRSIEFERKKIEKFKQLTLTMLMGFFQYRMFFFFFLPISMLCFVLFILRSEISQLHTIINIRFKFDHLIKYYCDYSVKWETNKINRFTHDETEKEASQIRKQFNYFI